MENKNNKRNTILLTIIGIATLLVAIVGATFAYFTATVTGNSEADNVKVTTDTYGLNIEGLGDGKIELLNQGLPQSEKGQDYTKELNFSIKSSSNDSHQISISFENVSNNFCKKVDSQESIKCNDEAEAGVDVSGELYYKLSSCTDSGYTSCDTVKVSETAMPHEAGVILDSDPITSKGTNYYKLVVGLKNKDALQNYNQGKSFSAKVVVSEKLN